MSQSPSKNSKLDNDDEELNKIETVTFKKKYLKIFKGKNEYYLLDRSKYDQNTIMMMLDREKINKLGEIYKDYPDGIEKAKFIEIMKEELTYMPSDLTNLVYGLFKFFQEIDFNGDGSMQWEEFTQFIIDTVEGDNDAKVDEGAEEGKNKAFNEKLMVKYKRYQESQKVKDSANHKKDIVTASFLSRCDLLLVNEYGTKTLRLYNPKTGKTEKNFELDNYLRPSLLKANNEQGDKRRNNSYETHLNPKNQKDKSSFKKNTSNTDNSYMVLHLSLANKNLIAMCLSDKRIVFFNFASDGRVELIHEMHTDVIEKRCWYLPEHNIWVSSGEKLPGQKHFTLNELDVEFELGTQKCDCYYNEGHPYRAHYCEKNPHEGEILDVIEMTKPMMILTACMDGDIRLINLNDKDIVKVWRQHERGVRCLDYNPLIETVGYVLSVGFEYYINIYCTDLSIDEAFKGKLEGHTAPVISCKFLSMSYMAVSVDEEGTARIWDTRNKVCLQFISNFKKNFKVMNMLCMPKYNMFVVYGNKMTFYEGKYREDEHKNNNQASEENYPIKVDFNKYYHSFFVTTFKDVRVFTKEGKLFKCYKKLINNEHFESDTRIKTFIFENNYRKFYVGFSNGAVMQYNAGNGSLIKPINEEEIERDGIQSYRYDHSKDVSSMYYYYTLRDEDDQDDEHLLLLTTSYDSLINIYNEANPEETEKLRTIKGGHTVNDKVNEISCMTFSRTLNLFATGSTEGLVVIWDFEMSKIDQICYSTEPSKLKSEVFSLKFLDPFPVLMVSYSDGSIYFWGVRQCEYRGQCILKALNFYKQNYTIELSSITISHFFNQEIEEINYKVPLKCYFEPNSDMIMNKEEFRKKWEEAKKKEEEEDYYDENKKETVLFDGKCYLSDEYRSWYSDKDMNPDSHSSSIDKTKYYLFMGDSKGNMKVLDLKGFFIKYKITPASQAKIKSNFNILKKEDLNVETILNHTIQDQLKHEDSEYRENQLKGISKQKANDKGWYNLYDGIIRLEWKAHDDEINSIEFIEEPPSFCTSSKDKLVKIWNYNGDCLGALNVLPKLSRIDRELPPWLFKVDEKELLKKEIEQIVEIFEGADIERIKVGSKQDLEIEETYKEEDEEEEVVEKRPVQKFNVKRFKKIEKDDNSKKNGEDEQKNNISYEKLYLQDAQRKIENLITGENNEHGMCEMTDKLMEKLVESNQKFKNIKEKKINIDGGNYPSKLISKVQLKPLTSQHMNKRKTGLAGNNIKKLSSTPMNVENQFLMSKAISGGFKEVHQPSKQRAITVEAITERPMNEGMLDQPISQIQNMTHTSKFSMKTKFKSGSKQKKKNMGLERNTLYSEIIFGKRNKQFVKSHAATETNFRPNPNKTKKMRLPFINEDKIIFRKGETEKLLNYEFYSNSYKKCADLNIFTRKPNETIIQNYKNNWDLVNHFSKYIKSKNDTGDEEEKEKNGKW